jgi:hypothetical protein
MKGTAKGVARGKIQEKLLFDGPSSEADNRTRGFEPPGATIARTLSTTNPPEFHPTRCFIGVVHFAQGTRTEGKLYENWALENSVS